MMDRRVHARPRERAAVLRLAASSQLPGCPPPALTLEQADSTPFPVSPPDGHDDEVECPHYLVDSKGTRVGCHFDKLAEPKRTDNYFFLVNGTSKQTAIQFVDFTPFKAVQMEKYNPPANITIRYNGSCHLIRWDNPETRFEMPSHMLCYELDIQRQARNHRHCKFYVLMKCEASNYTVHVTLRDGSVFSTWIQYLEQEGEPGSAAEHLDCWVHDVHVLTCSWQVGREAPRDVQYHLYLENVNTEQRWPCPQYTANDQGTYVQCRFGNISGFASTQYRLLVNGTSKDSRIRCSELVTPLSYIEKLTAPNMTGSCNESDSIMEWKMSSHLNTNFNYELEIQKVKRAVPGGARRPQGLHFGALGATKRGQA
ncbi:Interleukin-3 receptor subunit alpha [Pteropus alecto]|uniref:Interleukin-3 receptor subunit alpha n=1 Tax=Pteropus alecto TaxID=9402 RepID=L5KEU6_PTEAL|nr:Interleukin-3 receptor subunit alpha [Pteropus alecto]